MYYRENGQIVENYYDTPSKYVNNYSGYTNYGTSNKYGNNNTKESDYAMRNNNPSSYLGYTGHGIYGKGHEMCNYEGYKNKDRKVCGTTPMWLIILLVIILLIIISFAVASFKK